MFSQSIRFGNNYQLIPYKIPTIFKTGIFKAPTSNYLVIEIDKVPE